MDDTRDLKVEFMREAALTATRDMGPPLVFSPFRDWDFYYLRESISWKPDDPASPLKPVEVPKGFVTDLTSIPRPFWIFLPKTGAYAYAAILHDYIYWSQPRHLTREHADSILRLAMEELRVAAGTVATIYAAVSVAGSSAWDGNARLKAAGEKRILALFPDKPEIGWDEWKRQDVFAPDPLPSPDGPGQ